MIFLHFLNLFGRAFWRATPYLFLWGAVGDLIGRDRRNRTAAKILLGVDAAPTAETTSKPANRPAKSRDFCLECQVDAEASTEAESPVWRCPSCSAILSTRKTRLWRRSK